jgi:hypothetical protein
MREQDKFIVIGTLFVIVIAIFCAVFLNPIHKKNIGKLSQKQPKNREKITSTSVIGMVESIHPWGRTEVVPMKSVELEYFEYCDEWVMYGDVVQPMGRKDYFMPVLKGRLDLDVKEMTQTWIEHSNLATGPEEEAETYQDFKLAHIKVKQGKIINIKYTHYRLLPDHTWSIISAWNAQFNDDIPDFSTDDTQKIEQENIPIIICLSCKGTGERLTDINKLMMDASLALFVNHHLMVDKCKKCVKLPHGETYEYCETIQSKYQTLLKEYAATGPKIEMATCDKCMGMGTFSSKDLSTGKWITQKEHDEKHKKN